MTKIQFVKSGDRAWWVDIYRNGVKASVGEVFLDETYQFAYRQHYNECLNIHEMETIAEFMRKQTFVVYEVDG